MNATLYMYKNFFFMWTGCKKNEIEDGKIICLWFFVFNIKTVPINNNLFLLERDKQWPHKTNNSFHQLIFKPLILFNAFSHIKSSHTT